MRRRCLAIAYTLPGCKRYAPRLVVHFTDFYERPQSALEQVRESRARQQGPTLTEKLLENAGGTIAVHSQLSIGSPFTVILPRA